MENNLIDKLTLAIQISLFCYEFPHTKLRAYSIELLTKYYKVLNNKVKYDKICNDALLAGQEKFKELESDYNGFAFITLCLIENLRELDDEPILKPMEVILNRYAKCDTLERGKEFTMLAEIVGVS
jgi:hypothetical protein